MNGALIKPQGRHRVPASAPPRRSVLERRSAEAPPEQHAEQHAEENASVPAPFSLGASSLNLLVRHESPASSHHRCGAAYTSGKGVYFGPQAGLPLQRKLTVNTPGDAYEQEADRLAEEVMRMPEPQLPRPAAVGGGGAGCQNQPATPVCLRTKRVQAGDTGEMVAPSIVHDVLRSSGQPLDPTTRAFMEPRFGHDFSQVRVHTDARAAESAAAVNARAYSVGYDVVFGERQFAPGASAGKSLLAHELTHVVQQKNGDLHPGYAPTVHRKCEDCTDEEDKAKLPARRQDHHPAGKIEFETVVSHSLPSQDEAKFKCPAATAAPSSFSLGPKPAADIASWGACKWGGTRPEPLEIDTDCCEDGGNWKLTVEKVRSKVLTHSRQLAGQKEPDTTNATSGNFCTQVTELDALGKCPGSWYMLAAVEAHEAAHNDEWKTSFPTDWPALETKIEGLTAPASGATKSKEDAMKQMRSSATFTGALATSKGGGNFPTFWAIADPNANTDAAEHKVVDPRVKEICQHAKKQGWLPPACPACPAL